MNKDLVVVDQKLTKGTKLKFKVMYKLKLMRVSGCEHIHIYIYIFVERDRERERERVRLPTTRRHRSKSLVY